jgi:hypothetical protein
LCQAQLNVSPHVALERIICVAPPCNFIERAQTTLAPASSRIHLANRHAGRWHSLRMVSLAIPYVAGASRYKLKSFLIDYHKVSPADA